MGRFINPDNRAFQAALNSKMFEGLTCEQGVVERKIKEYL